MKTFNRTNVARILAALILFGGAAALNNACSSDDAGGNAGTGGTSILGDASTDRGTGGSGGTGGSSMADAPADISQVDGDATADVIVSDTPVEACASPVKSDAGCYTDCAPATDDGFLNGCGVCAFSYNNADLQLPDGGDLPALP